MTILQINKFFYPRGGTERHYLDLIDLLVEANYEVIPFSMKLNESQKASLRNPQLRALYDKYKDYFVDYIEFGPNKTLKDFLKFWRMFWSKNAAKKIDELLNDYIKILEQSKKSKKTKLIAHIHNIYHQISPSILPVLKKYKIAAVMTIHDLHLFYPIYAENVFEKIICSAELLLHNKILNVSKYIDFFIAPSSFVKKELLKYNIQENKIKVLPHFLKSKNQNNNFQMPSKEEYILYFGRLAPEKGINILIKAYLKSGIDLPLYIAGVGPLEGDLKTQYQIPRIKYLGNLHQEKLNQVIADSMFTVIPSCVPETFGMAALESYQYKKPVIAAKIGALPEVVKDQETGLLFIPKNIEDLAKKIKLLAQNKNLRSQLGENGYNYLKNFSPQNYLKNLISTFDQL